MIAGCDRSSEITWFPRTFDNANLKIELVDRGTEEMSFKAFSRSTQRTHTSLIEIQEFVSGPEKPFVGTTTLYYPGVYTGVCR